MTAKIKEFFHLIFTCQIKILLLNMMDNSILSQLRLVGFQKNKQNIILAKIKGAIK
jgi:hypothetical protein